MDDGLLPAIFSASNNTGRKIENAVYCEIQKKRSGIFRVALQNAILFTSGMNPCFLFRFVKSWTEITKRGK